ncbi:MAG: hypothetical protein K6L80_00310 [Agarilytica sp.]
MTKGTSHTPDMLMKQSGGMLLIDEISQFGETNLEAIVYHHPKCPFSNAQGKIPTWVGLEYMCQTILALEGVQRIEEKRPISIGFFLGTKRYQVAKPYFDVGEKVVIHVDEYMKNEADLGVHSCTIHGVNGEELASAIIKGAMPKDPFAIINRHK